MAVWIAKCLLIIQECWWCCHGRWVLGLTPMAKFHGIVNRIAGKYVAVPICKCGSPATCSGSQNQRAKLDYRSTVQEVKTISFFRRSNHPLLPYSFHRRCQIGSPQHPVSAEAPWRARQLPLPHAWGGGRGRGSCCADAPQGVLDQKASSSWMFGWCWCWGWC